MNCLSQMVKYLLYLLNVVFVVSVKRSEKKEAKQNYLLNLKENGIWILLRSIYCLLQRQFKKLMNLTKERIKLYDIYFYKT